MDMITNLSEQHSVLNHIIAEMRDNVLQKNPAIFRQNMQKAGFILAYEISKSLSYEQMTIQTPLAESEMGICIDALVVGSILRAGIPFHMGILDVFPAAENAFVSAYRKPKKKGDFEIVTEYVAKPSIKGKTLILADPMLATGQSMVACYALLCKKGKPKRTIIASAFASQPGIDFVTKNIPKAEIFTCVIDPELNSDFYIVPGLGDAGDLAFGPKLK